LPSGRTFKIFLGGVAAGFSPESLTSCCLVHSRAAVVPLTNRRDLESCSPLSCKAIAVVPSFGGRLMVSSSDAVGVAVVTEAESSPYAATFS